MKLFGDFEAVEFPEENMIFITCEGFLYYIYSSEHKRWSKYRNAGNDSITVSNYFDVSRDTLANAMHGVFPQKETDFMRLCDPAQLLIGDMMSLLEEDHPRYLSDNAIKHAIHRLLLASDICRKSYERLRKLLGEATENVHSNSRVLTEIKELSFSILGRDIFRREIGIIDGHDGSSYFWIKPVRVIDYEDTADLDSVAELKSAEISIEEDDAAQYLLPFFYRHFDEKLEENVKRRSAWGFEECLERNFFTMESMARLLKDVEDAADALASGRETEYTRKLGIGSDAEAALVVDFYRRFLYRMEYMMRIGKEKGYDLISVMGP